MITKTLAVIIPNYNKSTFLSKTIDSILDQSILPNEIIIIDDCSNDNSKEIIKGYSNKYPNIIVPVLLESNHGVQYCRNLGVNMSKSTYICFIDSDDFILDKECFEKQLKVVCKNKLVGVYQLCIDDKDCIISSPLSKMMKIRFKTFYRYYMFLLQNFMLWPMHYIVNRQKVIDVGLFDFKYNLFEDADLVFKLFEAGVKPKWINIEGKAYRINMSDPSHLSNANKEKQIVAMELFHKKHYNKLPLFTKLMIRVSRNWKRIKNEIE